MTGRWTSMLRDIVNLLPVGYFVVIHERHIQFIRVSGGRRFRVLLQTEPTAESEVSLPRFLGQLEDSPHYFGQPLVILLNDRHAFSYLRWVHANELTAIGRKLKSLVTERAAVDVAFKPGADGTLVMAQGIEREHLDQLIRSVREHGLNVTAILTVPVYLAGLTHVLSRGKDQLVLLEWSSLSWSYVASQANGNVFVGEVSDPGSQTLTEAEEQLQTTLFGNDHSMTPVHYYQGTPSSKSDKNRQASLATLFRDSTLINRQLKGLFKRTGSSRASTALALATNSLKLLILVLLPILTVAVIAGALLGIQSDQRESEVGVYQRLHSEEYLLNRQLDSLKSIQSSYAANQVTHIGHSTLLSLFCQESRAELYLNSVVVRRYSKDSSVVEVVGAAKQESGIFEHNRLLNELAKPFPVAINLIRPEIVSVQGITDTVLNFKYSMVIHERTAQE